MSVFWMYFLDFEGKNKTVSSSLQFNFPFRHYFTFPPSNAKTVYMPCISITVQSTWIWDVQMVVCCLEYSFHEYTF